MMTAQQMAAEIAQLRDDSELWEHALGNGIVVRVRRMPDRLFGHWYLVWASRRPWDAMALRERGREWSGAKSMAVKPATAGKKARALVTQHSNPSAKDITP